MMMMMMGIPPQVARALNQASGPDTIVEFAISGESGLSTFTYPQSWFTAMQQAKAVSSAGKDVSKHLYGVSFNWWVGGDHGWRWWVGIPHA